MGGNAVMRAATIWLAVGTGCATPRTGAYKAHVREVVEARSAPPRRIPALTPVEPLHWKVGQWVLYRQHHAGKDDASYRQLRVIAQDGCGIWIEVTDQTYDHREQSMLCFKPPVDRPTGAPEVLGLLQTVIVRVNGNPPLRNVAGDGGSPARTDQVEATASNLVVPSFADLENATREDVDVAAGHFAGTVRTTSIHPDLGTWTTWRHPVVPFDAVVKATTTDGFEIELLGFGYELGASVVTEQAKELSRSLLSDAGPRGRQFIGIGVGMSWLGRGSVDDSSARTRVVAQGGARLSRTLDVIAEAGLEVGESPMPAVGHDVFSALVGVRWRPWARDPVEPQNLFGGVSGLFVQAGAGYSELLADEAVEGRGVAAAITAGWLLYRGHDWDVSLQVSDHLGFYSSGEGFRNSLGVTSVIQLYLPETWRHR